MTESTASASRCSQILYQAGPHVDDWAGAVVARHHARTCSTCKILYAHSSNGEATTSLITAATSKDGSKDNHSGVKPLAYWQLYGYMDTLDVILVIVGSIGAIAAGTALPLVSLVMGRYRIIANSHA